LLTPFLLSSFHLKLKLKIKLKISVEKLPKSKLKNINFKSIFKSLKPNKKIFSKLNRLIYRKHSQHSNCKPTNSHIALKAWTLNLNQILIKAMVFRLRDWKFLFLIRKMKYMKIPFQGIITSNFWKWSSFLNWSKIYKKEFTKLKLFAELMHRKSWVNGSNLLKQNNHNWMIKNNRNSMKRKCERKH
jgi:hypothetical protein